MLNEKNNLQKEEARRIKLDKKLNKECNIIITAVILIAVIATTILIHAWIKNEAPDYSNNSYMIYINSKK